ncbi:MAG: hypothetical protein LBH98_09865 [Chitinispirillales bacterium]|nr:hypothetical protein [Chitinispirillales bacterium]
MRKRIKCISAGIGFLLLLCSAAFCSVDMMVLAHETDSARIDSLERQLPFLEAKVASTMRNGASAPVTFDGQIQLRSQFHNYGRLKDSSYLYLTRQGVMLNGDNPLVRVGIVASPGRSTTLWTTFGLNAMFSAYNPHQFLEPEGLDYDGSWYYDVQHHSSGSAGRGLSVYEDMCAGIAIRTRPASFMLKLGSMNWMEASPLSIWSASPKMFAWEYLPYEEEEPVGNYYSNKITNLEQVGRGVWNKRAFQGIDFSVIDLPWGLRGFFLFGIGNPYDMTHRYHMDMAVDLGYAGDEGSIVESGIGDSYRKFVFYRLSKRLENHDITIGVNNGYVHVNDDIIYAGYNYGNLFNQKFNIGRYGSEWINTATNERDVILSKDRLDKIAGWGKDAKVESLGEGFLVAPRILTIDTKGSIGKNFSFGLDLGMSWIDTQFIKIDPKSYDYSDNPADDIYDAEDGEYGSSGTSCNPGRILSKRKETSSPDFAAYGNMTYNWARIQGSIEMLLAGDNFYSPYSMVNNTDAFWAFGSNMVGTQAFQNMEAAEYSKNLRSLKLTLVPKTPSWHGHLKFGYQLNSQNKEARDILVLPYRLNGATLHSTLNHWYSKWGLGTITEGYDFMNHQGGVDNVGSLAKHTQNRFGDQSYTADNAPHKGGMRSDFDAVSEIVVPFESAEQVIFNYFSGSTVVGTYRDLRNIWHSGSESSGELSYEHGKFIDAVGRINAANTGNGIRVSDKDGNNYYKIDENTVTADGRADLVISDEDGNVVKTKNVSLVSNSGFVPVSIKKSFDFNVDWALNIAKYIGYKNSLILSLYYEVNGVTRNGIMPIAFTSKDDKDDKTLLVSHYLRSEPTIGITKKFYITSLVGFEKWLSGKTWTGEYEYDNGSSSQYGLLNVGEGAGAVAESYTLTGIKQSRLEINDLALGIGFDWDMMKRVSMHGRYKWLKHNDVNMPFNNFTGNVVSLELKAFF